MQAEHGEAFIRIRKYRLRSITPSSVLVSAASWPSDRPQPGTKTERFKHYSLRRAAARDDRPDLFCTVPNISPHSTDVRTTRLALIVHEFWR